MSDSDKLSSAPEGFGDDLGRQVEDAYPPGSERRAARWDALIQVITAELGESYIDPGTGHCTWTLDAGDLTDLITRESPRTKAWPRAERESFIARLEDR
jgi:hypothetical protein